MAGLTHRAVNIELASSAASPKKTDPAPAAPAIAPAEAGTTNWPTRFAVNRAEMASARSSGGASLETKDIVKGWPTPSANPANATAIPKEIGLRAKNIAAQKIVEAMMLTSIKKCEPNLWAIAPKKMRENIEVPARIAKITPTENGEKLFSVPNSGKKTIKTSTADEIASEI